MKKLFYICCLSILFCSGCKFKINNLVNKEDNKAPTTLVNTSNVSGVETDLVKLYNDSVKSVVTVLNYASYYDRGKVVTNLYSSGSGFIYACDDDYIYLYTNGHVVGVGTGYNQSYYEIVFYDGFRSYGNLVNR